jgi:hypothetical protein
MKHAKKTQTKYTRRNRHRRHRHREYLGGSSFEQKGVAAQLRPSTPHSSALRRKLNEIVHSGDFYESKERNSFLNLDNDFDPEAQDALNEAVDYIKNNKDLSSKIKKRVLQGIAPVTTTQRTNHDNTSTKRMRTRTPTKTNRTSTGTIKSLNSRNKSRSKSRTMTRRRSNSMF